MLKRIEELRKYLPNEFSAFLIKSDVNRFYYTGFRSSAGCFLLTKNSIFLLVDFRYFEAASKKVSKDIRVICYHNLYNSINDIFKDEDIKAVYIEEDFTTVSDLNVIKDSLSAEVVCDINLSEIIYNQRCIKDDSEIDKIISAQRIAEKSFLEVLNYIKNGVSEKNLSIELEYLMKKYGAEKTSFDSIVVSGVNSSLPHGVPTEKTIENGEFITFDIGAVYDGYCSDMTRTISFGNPTDEMREIYEIVLCAHKAAKKEILPNNTCADVDLAAREYIISKGYGDYFGHSTGHGVGIEIHEKPTVYKTNKNPLSSGMIITNEPGIYLPKKFGVRIEDMYLVKEYGAVSLASIDKELIIL